MDTQTKNEIIAEITTTAVKTIEQTIQESLKRTLPDFVYKTTDKALNESKVQQFQNLIIKEIKSGTKQITASWTKNRSSNKFN